MELGRRLNPIENWHYDIDPILSTGERQVVSRYHIAATSGDCNVLYELLRDSDGTWSPRISADGTSVYEPRLHLPTAEDALAALSKHVGFL